MNVKDLHFVCKACGVRRGGFCQGNICIPYQSKERQAEILKKPLPIDYPGLRFTSDAMDCALPIAIDSHNACTFACVYCFANNLRRSLDRNPTKILQLMQRGTQYSEWNIKSLEKFLAYELGGQFAKAMYPLMASGVPVQLGALGDPFDDLERVSGWALKAIPLFIKYKVPVRVGTKGGDVLMLKSYQDAIGKSPEQFWFAFSIITASDRLIEEIDINAPNTTARLRAMKALSKLGCSCSIRIRPTIPNITDQYKGEPEAWRVLLDKAAEAGARAVSFEFLFLESAVVPRQLALNHKMNTMVGDFRENRFFKEWWKSGMWRSTGETDVRTVVKLEKLYRDGGKFTEWWSAMSNPEESCQRSNRDYKRYLTKCVVDYAHKLGLSVGISDPHWKEWNDYGCCCGIPDTHPWLGKWSHKNMTTALVELRKNYGLWKAGKAERLGMSYRMWRPQWAHMVEAGAMIDFGSFLNKRALKNCKFGDTMRNKMNVEAGHVRAATVYFRNVMHPPIPDLNPGCPEFDEMGDRLYYYDLWEDVRQFSARQFTTWMDEQLTK